MAVAALGPSLRRGKSPLCHVRLSHRVGNLHGTHYAPRSEIVFLCGPQTCDFTTPAHRHGKDAAQGPQPAHADAPPSPGDPGRRVGPPGPGSPHTAGGAKNAGGQAGCAPASPAPAQLVPSAVLETAAPLAIAHGVQAVAAGDGVVQSGGTAGKGKGTGKSIGPAWPSFDVRDTTGEVVGQIKYGSAGGILSAHCLNPSHGLCRLQRTVRASEHRPSQGRPLGFLIAWLWRGHLHESRESHFADRIGDVVTFDDRCAARVWAEGSEAMAFPLSKERPLRPGEAPEPTGNP